MTLNFNTIAIAEQKVFNEHVFPLVLTYDCNKDMPSLDTLTNHFKTDRSSILHLLQQYKAILFRGYNCIKDGYDFDKVVTALNLNEMPYIGGAAVRTQITSKVFTANESPSTESIPFHHEMSQVPQPPTHLFFYCESPPTYGGQTPILISSIVYNAMLDKYPDFITKLETTGVKYVRTLPEYDDASSAIGRGWRSTYNVSTREDVERELDIMGSTYVWMNDADNSVKTTTKALPAIRKNEKSNERVFFNSCVAAYKGWNDSRNRGHKAVMHGDGAYLDPEIMGECAAFMDDISVAFTWCTGDVLLLDNRTTMHSRRPFEGSRRILASLARDPEN